MAKIIRWHTQLDPPLHAYRVWVPLAIPRTWPCWLDVRIVNLLAVISLKKASGLWTLYHSGIKGGMLSAMEICQWTEIPAYKEGITVCSHCSRAVTQISIFVGEQEEARYQDNRKWSVWLFAQTSCWYYARLWLAHSPLIVPKLNGLAWINLTLKLPRGQLSIG